MYDPIMDLGRKEKIEKDLIPLDFEQMVFQGFCEQEVAIRNNFKISKMIVTLFGKNFSFINLH